MMNSGYVVARHAIVDGRITWYHVDPTGLGLASLLGTASTISNGYYLVFTAPLWIITGSIATFTYAREPVVSLGSDAARDLRPFARFPIGMPAGLDASFRRLGASERNPLPRSPMR